MKLKAGINKDIPNEAYHADRSHISSSGLKLILTDPEMYYRQYVLGEKVTFNQENMDFGSYIHALILEPETVEKEFAIFDGLMKRGEAWEAFKGTIEDRIVITKSQKVEAERLMSEFDKATVLLEDNTEVSIGKEFFTKGLAEQTFCGRIGDTRVKVRFDYRQPTKGTEFPPCINDVKTTSSSIKTADHVKKICDKFHYDLSAALYVDIAEQVTGEKHDFYFTFIAKKHDPVVKIYKASKEMLQRGRDKYLEAVKRLEIAKETGIYYTNRIEEIN